jgi:hypothetical protein
VVGRDRAGVSAADTDDLDGCVVFSHAPKTPPIPET